jgi:hypothetical protein
MIRTGPARQFQHQETHETSAELGSVVRSEVSS